MKAVLTILILLIPIWVSNIKCEQFRANPKSILNEDIVLLTRLVRAEAQTKLPKDKLFIVQVVLNRKTPCESITDVLSAPNQFQGYLSKRWFKELKMEDYELIDSFLQTGQKLHNYHSFLNPFIATNKSYRDYAVKQRGEWVGEHWYWEEK